MVSQSRSNRLARCWQPLSVSVVQVSVVEYGSAESHRDVFEKCIKINVNKLKIYFHVKSIKYCWIQCIDLFNYASIVLVYKYGEHLVFLVRTATAAVHDLDCTIMFTNAFIFLLKTILSEANNLVHLKMCLFFSCKLFCGQKNCSKTFIQHLYSFETRARFFNPVNFRNSQFPQFRKIYRKQDTITINMSNHENDLSYLVKTPKNQCFKMYTTYQQ